MAKSLATERFVSIENSKRESSIPRFKIHKRLKIDNSFNVEHVQSRNKTKKFKGAKDVVIKYLHIVKDRKDTPPHEILSCERYITMAVRLLSLLILSLMIVIETQSYNENPTGTTVEDDMYPIQGIDFPAVGICNINVISRRKALNFAEDLWTRERVRNIKNITLDRVKNVLKYMGHLYLFEDSENETGDIEVLHEILTAAFNPNYSVLKIMQVIAASCHSFLKGCSWGGEIRSCEELFTPRWTQDGLCCTFNYVRWNEEFTGRLDDDFNIDVERSLMNGPEHGLRIFLNCHTEDYYYNILPGKGFKILIFSATDYPDAPSGEMREILASCGAEAYINLQATSFHSSPDVIKYDKKKRGCLFNSELDETYDGSYSYSQCIMLCRTRDIFKKCGCTPFFYPFNKELETSKDCGLVDLACLKSHRYKWWSVKPMEDDVLRNSYPMYVDEFVDENLNCDCLPSCENVYYTIFKTGGLIHPWKISWIDFVKNLHKDNVTKDSVLLNISFGTGTIIRLRQDVLYYWYDLMSNYGGMCSLFLGLSILTPIERVYLFCRRVCRQRRGRNKFSNDKNLPTIVDSKFVERSVYWSEIYRSRRENFDPIRIY